MRKFFYLVISIMILTAGQAQKTKLSLNLEKGKEYKQITDSKSTITQEINGQEINMVMTIKGSTSYLVTAVNKKSYEMDVEYDSLSITMEFPQSTLEFSSEKSDEKDIFSTILAEMKNKPFQVIMTRSGKVKEVNNIELLFESVFSKFPQIPENQIAQIKSQLMKSYGEEAFKGNIEMVTAIYPNKPVVKGGSWVIKTKLRSGMSADMTTTYKYSEDAPDYYLIEGASKIESTGKGAYVESEGMSMKYEVTGNMSSVIKTDKTSGWIVEATLNQYIQGDVYIKENPQMPDGMKIPMVMKNNMTFTNN